MEIKNINIFSPLILIAVVFFYVLFAFIGTNYHLRGLPSVSLLTYLYIIYGVLIFIVGFLAARIIEKYFFEKNFKQRNAREIIRCFLDYLERLSKFNERNLLIWTLIPLILESINLYFLGGIPLFSGYLKLTAFNNLTVISYLLFIVGINALMARFYRRRYFILLIIGVVLFAATGFRSPVIGILLSVLITLYYINGNKFKYFLILAPTIIILGLILGSVAANAIQWQHWDVNPLILVFIRAGYTLTILDKIVAIQNSTHGLIAYHVLMGYISSTDPRLFLGETVLNRASSITSTIFGPAILDAGYLGLTVQMFFFGLMLELLHYLQKIKKGLYTSFYAIGLASTIVWVETSPMDLAVWIYYLIGIIIILTVVYHMKYKASYTK